MAFSGLKAMGIAPKSMSSYFGEEEPIGWSGAPIAQRGYSSPSVTPFYLDPQANQRRQMQNMAQDYEYQKLQDTIKDLPEIQKMEDIEREERMKSGLERLNQLKTRSEIQNQFQQGAIDYWTPEGRRKLTQAVGMGAITPSTISAIRSASPKAEALTDAVYNLHGIDPSAPDADVQLQGILANTDKSLHLEPEFKYALRDTQGAIAKLRAENDKALINRAIESGMNQDELMKYLNPEMTRVANKEGFMKSYGEYLRESRAKKELFTPEWKKKDEELQYQAIERAAKEPDPATIDNYIMSKDLNRDFVHQPITPEERMAAAQRWKVEPAQELQFRRQAMQTMLDRALGREPVQQQSPVGDTDEIARNLVKRALSAK